MADPTGGEKQVYRRAENSTARPQPAARRRLRLRIPRGRAGLLTAGLALVMAVLLGVLVLVACTGRGLVVTPLSGSVPAAFGSAAATSSESYDPEAYRLQPQAYMGTVLPQLEDAGMDYLRETLFLGDSNTNRMLYYHDVTGVTIANGIGVDSMGITTFRTQRCASYERHGQVTMPEAVALLQPRRVVMTFGTNNVGMELERFISHYEDAIEAVREACPYTDIIIGAIFPVDQYRQNTAITMQRIDRMNQALVEMAKAQGVKFLNWAEAIRDEATGHSLFEATIQDGVHLTRFGMERIFEYCRTHHYITEDSHPGRTGPAAVRIAVQPGLVTKDPYKVPGPIDWSKYEDDSSSEAAGEVNVVFCAWDVSLDAAGGGTLSGGGAQGTSFTLCAAPGATTAPVQATPAPGYEFVGWSCTVGSIGTGSAGLPGFTVPGHLAAGDTVTVTATFRQIPAQSQSVSSSVAASVPSSEAQQPPVSEQPVSSAVPSSGESSLPPGEVPPEGGNSEETG